MADKFGPYVDTPTAPSRHVTTLVPSDSTDLTDTPKGIYVGTGGDVKLIAVDAPASAPGVTFKNVPAGSLLPVRARRVLATGTTAADMLVLL
ncbi:spike base protein, RCAP_Rcc01079 family [Sphingomonas aracearum]|uniref:Uncharacterized protein n=1 Tax=Sphingomonas aracearum TaxID=2283317 RepID=A0A369VUV5_9SPHN|nr:hypothetical protein [Sphingomonas aracearum]RDE05435.1 hypothetical protein DVW87_09295 [Sphingomonas aracearum]